MRKLAWVALGLTLAVVAALLFWRSGSINNEAQEEADDVSQAAAGLELVEHAFPFSIQEAWLPAHQMELGDGELE